MKKLPIILAVLTIAILLGLSLLPTRDDLFWLGHSDGTLWASVHSWRDVLDSRAGDSQKHTKSAASWLPTEATKGIMQIAISLTLLACSAFIILAKRYGPKDKHWAFGMVGTIVGFWLK